MRIKTLPTVIAVMLASLTATAACSANEIVAQTLDEKVSRSDLVITGIVVEILPCGISDTGECSSSSVTAKVLVQDTLKGTAPKEILFRCKESIPEFSPSACAPGVKYLMFLQQDGKGVFHSVNGPRGVYNLTKSSVQ